MSNVKPFNIAEQIRIVILSMQNLWDEKQIEFDIDLQEIIITANEDLLVQVWLNLIGNAIKFSPKKEIIYIKLFEKDGKTVFSITNTSEVIDKETLQKLFDKFYQVDKSRTTSGNGIGLSIVKKICKLHNGDISVESTHEKGTIFTVVL